MHDAPDEDDGFRVLVDRLWPRGVTKERAHVDLWLKEVAPSTTLRMAFHHHEMAFEDFARVYREELAENPALDQLRAVVAEHPVVTLVYGARDPEHNHVVVLVEALG